MTRRITLAERVYRALLFCYPADFRYEYGPEMTQVFRDRYREGHGRIRLWLDAARYRRQGAVYTLRGVYADKLVQAFPDRFHRVYANEVFTVYQISSPPQDSRVKR